MTVTTLENLALSEDGTYRRIDSEKEAYAEIQIEPEPGKSLYLFLPGASLNVTVTVDGKELMNGNRDYAPFPICLDAYVVNEPVSAHVELLKDELENGFHAYVLDTDRLALLAESVNAAAPLIERTGETSFRLTTEAQEEERLLVSSIPFDAGWQVKANGKNLPLKMIHESMLGFVLPGGCDSVEISYQPYGQKAGLILSGVSVLLWAGLMIYEKRNPKGTSKNYRAGVWGRQGYSLLRKVRADARFICGAGASPPETSREDSENKFSESSRDRKKSMFLEVSLK